MSEMMQASRQWSSRPADERFWSVKDLAEHCDTLQTEETFCKLNQLTAHPIGDDIVIITDKGEELNPTNWSFEQLCENVGAPSKFLTSLPAKNACDDINYKLRGLDEMSVLFTQKTSGTSLLRAITTPKYSRFYDKELCSLLTPFIKEGWKVPPARPAGIVNEQFRPATENDLIPGMVGGNQVRLGENIAPSGVYRGDRDSFIFLVNGSKQIDDGTGEGGLFKGIIASNSEVGNGAIHFQTFCHEGVCGNHIVWGASNILDMKRVHRGDLQPFRRKLVTWLQEWSGVEMAETEKMIVAAKQKVLGATDQEVIEEVYKLGCLTKRVVKSSLEWAEKWEHTAHASPRTVWGFVHGLTRYSQTVDFTRQRHILDMAGGKILGLVS